MAATSTAFKNERAPCGRLVDGEHFQDPVEEGMVTDNWYYACGCRIIRHEYHDGSVCRHVTRHDGKALVDEYLDHH